MSSCLARLKHFHPSRNPRIKRRKLARRFRKLIGNQTKICQFFCRIGNQSSTRVPPFPRTVKLHSCPTDTQKSHEQNKPLCRRHSHWMKTWFDSHLPHEARHKRSLDTTNDRNSISKRRLTFGELRLAAPSEDKENSVAGLFTRLRSTHEEGAYRPSVQRPKLCEIPHQQTKWNMQNIAPSKDSDSHKISAQDACQVESIIRLDLLNLSDDKRAADSRFARPRKHAKSVPSTLDIVPSKTKEHALHVCENTRFMGSMFHHPVSAVLVKDSECRPNAGEYVHLESKDSYLESGAGCPNTLVFWLPKSPVDEVLLDEFHQNHERIFRYIYARDLELTSQYDENFLKHNGLTPDIRATLADWMIKVQQYLKLRTETLHLAVSIVDRYTWLRSGMNPANYQLVGITSLFVAAKFVERFAPTTATLCYLTENSYKPKQVLDCELHLLQILGFEVAIPLPHQFLVRAALACSDLSPTERAKVELISCYLFELSLTEVTAVGVPASLRCAAAVRLVRQLIGLEQANALRSTSSERSTPCNVSFTVLEEWPEFMCRSVGHEDTPQLRAMCSVYMRALMRFRNGTSSSNQRYEAAFHKFSNRGYKSIAQCSTVQQVILAPSESCLCTTSLVEPTV